MKSLKEFLDRHPIISMFVFNAVAIPVATIIGLIISYFSGFQSGTVIFVEAIIVLIFCYSAINGNSNSRTSLGVYDRSTVTDTQYYLGAYHFAIKYGILGVGLFALSGLFGMQ